jgi:hypothetical protein
MSTEYSFFGIDIESSASTESQHICWKSKYNQLLNEYNELLCCFHCHVKNMTSTMKEEESDSDDEETEKKPSVIELLKQKNHHLVKTIMDLQREIKYKVPMNPHLHPINDLSMNKPRVLHIYSHPDFLHKHHRHPHPYPYPYPYPHPHPYHHRDISMNIPHHIYPHPIPIPHHPANKDAPIMPQHAHIPPPVIPHPVPPVPSSVKPLTKDILNYPYPYGYGYPYGGYPYSYLYGYGYPYSSYYPYYRDLPYHDHHKDVNQPGVKKPRPPLHPVLHPIQ